MMAKATFRWPDRIASLVLLRLLLWVAVAAFTHEGILSDPFKLADWMDDHQFYSWEEENRDTLLRWHQLPAWNPFWCGGTIGIGQPEGSFFAPDFLLRIVFGVAHGRRLAIVLFVVLAFEGMYRLCRRLDSSAVGAAFAALVYGTCDRFVSYIHDGWVNFMGFELIPFVLYFLIVGTLGPANDRLTPEQRRGHIQRARLLGGFFFAWIVLAAGTYPAPYAVLAAGYVTIALSVYGFLRGQNTAPAGARRWQRLLGAPWLLPWICAATIGVVAFGLASAKIFPLLSFMRQSARTFTPVEAHSASEMFSAFWTHYSAVGVLMLIGVITSDLAAGIFCGGAIFFFALSTGDQGAASAFHLLKKLPVFSQLRFPDRFMVGVVLFAAVASSRGLTRLEDFVPAAVKRLWSSLFDWLAREWGKKKRPYPVELGWLMVGIAAYVAYAKVARPVLGEILEAVRIKRGTMYVLEPPRRYDGPFRQSRGNRRDAHIFSALNMGSIYCVAGNPIPESGLLRGDLAQEEYPQDPTKATVKRLEWSPNRIELEVDAKEPTTILVNQNWASSWRTNVGTVKSVDKLLALDVPGGKHIVVLAYKDRILDLGLFVSFLTLVGVGFVFGRDGVRWAKRERLRWATLPLWPGGALPPAASASAPADAAPAEVVPAEVAPAAEPSNEPKKDET